MNADWKTSAHPKASESEALRPRPSWRPNALGMIYDVLTGETATY
jgi:hypothetical protein